MYVEKGMPAGDMGSKPSSKPESKLENKPEHKPEHKPESKPEAKPDYQGTAESALSKKPGETYTTEVSPTGQGEEEEGDECEKDE